MSDIEHSMDESVRFAVQRTLVEEGGRVRCTSSFVDQDGTPMKWHDFGCLEGPGWAANAVGGAWELLLYARRNRNPGQEKCALGLVDHVLGDGFIDQETGLITAYRDTTTGALCQNYTHGSAWLCPGSMARVACQMLAISDLLDPDVGTPCDAQRPGQQRGFGASRMRPTAGTPGAARLPGRHSPSVHPAGLILLRRRARTASSSSSS